MMLKRAVDGVALGAWWSHLVANTSLARHSLQNVPAVSENSWNSICIWHWIVGANSSYPAKQGRTAVPVSSASAEEVVFEGLIKNAYLNQPVLEPKLFKIYANNV